MDQDTDKDKNQENWEYNNAQWTQLPKHMRHLPLIQSNIDLSSRMLKAVWAIFLKVFFFKFYVRLKIVGDIDSLVKTNPRLLVISNHSSHLDAVSIAAAVPFKQWYSLYSAAAKDYFFSSPLKSFFSKHFIGAIPIDRNGKKGEAVKLCIEMLTALDRIWLVIFPEGTRSKDGKISSFKRGVSLFATKTNTPILFLYLEGAYKLFPKGASLPRPGKLKIHIGPVHPPSEIDAVNEAYRKWVNSIAPDQFND